MDPAFMSLCRTTWVAVQVVEAPGARLLTGHAIAPSVVSVTVKLEMVEVPVFVIWKEYVIVLPSVVEGVASEVLWMMTFPSSTLRVAKAWLPSPPAVEVTFPVRLFFTPRVVPATFTLNVHEPRGPSVAPDRLILSVPVEIEPPPHEPLNTTGLSITRPAGSASEKPVPASDTAFVLVMVKLRVVVPNWGIVVAANALLIVGGPVTVQVALPNASTVLLSALWPMTCTMSALLPGIRSGM